VTCRIRPQQPETILTSQGIQALNRLNDAQRMMDRFQDSSLNDQALMREQA
jgi:hypothetical protein